MEQRRISEQLVGYGWLLLIAILTGLGIWFIHRDDSSRERRDDERARTRYVRDSVEAARLAKEQQRLLWAQEKEERAAKRKEWQQSREARQERRQAESEIELILQPFDPNSADSTTLVHLGLKPWMARNVLRYRDKGGRYRKKEDLKKLYGMTDSLYLSLEPYICITPLEQDTLSLPRYVSFKRDTIIELNTADTASLQLIRGIAGYTARQIIRLRDELGGYYSVEQIREIERLRRIDSIIPHLMVDTTLIRPLMINKLGVERLSQHPYIRFEQAKAIREWRHRHGPILSIETLRDLEMNGHKTFSEAELLRLRPYLSFEK